MYELRELSNRRRIGVARMGERFVVEGMGERSLQASQKGIQLAKQALTSKRLRQKDLIGFVCQSRQPISKFFTGKPVDREIFVGIAVAKAVRTICW